MIVIGGADTDLNYLDTTEVYKDNLWRTVYGKLPAIAGLKATTVNNRPLAFGEIYHAWIIFSFVDFQVEWITPMVSEIIS